VARWAKQRDGIWIVNLCILEAWIHVIVRVDGGAADYATEATPLPYSKLHVVRYRST
jgi:hypothetical protein